MLEEVRIGEGLSRWRLRAGCFLFTLAVFLHGKGRKGGSMGWPFLITHDVSKS